MFLLYFFYSSTLKFIFFVLLFNSDCKRCTLRLDHHCPWVGSCIGYYNQKVFFLFLLYGIIAITISCVWHIMEIARIFSTKKDQDTVIVQLAVLIFIGSFCLALCNKNNKTLFKYTQSNFFFPVFFHFFLQSHFFWHSGALLWRTWQRTKASSPSRSIEPTKTLWTPSTSACWKTWSSF